MRRWRLLWFCLLLFGPALSAEDTGQICLQAYADANENGRRDADEASISRGVGASLLDDRGFVIAVQLLADAPYAARGLLCFADLPAGAYQLHLTSSEFAVTGPQSAAATVAPGLPPPRLDFGLRPLFVEEAAVSPAATIDSVAALRLLFALLASAFAVSGMTALGILIYVLVFYRQLRRQPPPAAG